MTEITKAAEIVDEGVRTATDIAQFSETKKLTLNEAYAIQALSMQRRYARGEKRIGIKWVSPPAPRWCS
ncbi:hypothetical protein [Donghicola tyrosinivorans]|uniref:Uncharacterized protein n=1 Tax=Donghicola tyrosinivorans TaxID=1652492 RepID=A0A2T0WEC1_9RHOB|nr:hypothetical protein [Donghicola tyrosinivorans]PRY85042.1 hypothetical protein CLV74_11813 [Donghicola tyrosinivorans]